MLGASRQWQHPHVDIFKSFGTDASSNSPFPASSLVADVRGDVTEEMDREICKHVFRIQGAVSANNFIQLPGKKVKSMSLTGEYVYLLLKPLDMKFFLVHLDFVVSSGNRLRISLSNIYDEVKFGHHAIQCPCKLPDSWTVVRLHVPSILHGSHALPHGFMLRCLQLCASIVVRSVFTSDRLYTPQDAPRELAPGASSCWSWMDVPGGTPATVPVVLPPKVAKSRPKQPSDPGTGDAAVEPSEPEEASERQEDGGWPKPAMRISRVLGVTQQSRRIGKEGAWTQVPQRCAVFAASPTGPEDEIVERLSQSSNLEEREVQNKVVSIASMSLALWSDEGVPRHFFGHTRPVELVEGSDDGQWIASVQGATASASAPVLRLWRPSRVKGLDCTISQSLSTLSSVQSVAFDGSNRFLAVAGQDARERQNLLIFDMSRAKGGAINLIAQQFGPDVGCIRFSPFEELNLVSCGMENIRFWRVKEKHIPGCQVPLGVLGRQTQFTCVGFECRKMGHSFFLGDSAAEKVRCFVATGDGRVLQVGYKSRKVLAVHQLHNEAITWICSNEVFVVTAGCDHVVRVWPVDFNSFYLHSKHDSVVVGLDLTVDGRKVLCSTADGSIGVLDVRSHQYKDIYRSHKATILKAAVSERFQEVATISSDGAIKVWKLGTLEEVHQFQVEDQPQVLVFHPQRHLLSVAFHSGAVRIFDMETQAQVRELQLGRSPVLALEVLGTEGFHQGEEFVICDSSGTLAIFDEAFNLLRSFQCPSTCSGKPSLNANPRRLLWPAGSRSAVLLNLADGRSVAMISAPEGSKVSSCSFSWHGRYAVLCGENKRVHVFEAEGGSHVFSCAWSSSPACEVLLVEPDDQTNPWMLMVSSVDRLLRTSRLHVTSTEVGLEQTFAAHAVAAHQLLLTRGGASIRCISVSSSELLCWDFSSRLTSVLDPPTSTALPEVLSPAALEEAKNFLEELTVEPERATIRLDSVANEVMPQTLDALASNLEEASAMVEALAADIEASPGGANPADEALQPFADSGQADEPPKELPGDVPAAVQDAPRRLVFAGVHGCSVCGPQSSACQLPWLCYILGSDVCLEDTSQATPTRRILSAPTDEEGQRWQALVVEMDGASTVAAVFACSSTKLMRLCKWTTGGDGPQTIDLVGYGNLVSCLMRLLSNGQMAVTAPVRDLHHGDFQVDLWRFGAEGVWASAQLPSQPLELRRLESKEFGVLAADGLTFWRFDDECDADTGAGLEDLDASCARLQFQAADPPADWDITKHGPFVSMATAEGQWLESAERAQQLSILMSARGMLWVHDVDDNVHISSFQVPSTAGVTSVACAWPLLVYAAGQQLSGFKIDGAAPVATGDLHLDGNVTQLWLWPSQRGIAVTVKTIWSFDLVEKTVVPLHSFHQAPCQRLARSGNGCGNLGKGEALCSASGKELRLWHAEDEVLLEVARLTLQEAAPCVALQFLPDGFLACALTDGTILFFDIKMFGLVSRAVIPMQAGCNERDEQLTTMEVLLNSSELQLILGTSHGRILRIKVQGCNKVCTVDPGATPFSTFVAESVAAMGCYAKQGVTCGVFALGTSGELSLWTRDAKRTRVSGRHGGWSQLEVAQPADEGSGTGCFLPLPQPLLALAPRTSNRLMMYSCQDASLRHEVQIPFPVLGMDVKYSKGYMALLCAGAEHVAALLVDAQGARWVEDSPQPLPGWSLQAPSTLRKVCAHSDSQLVWIQSEASLSAWRIGAL